MVKTLEELDLKEEVLNRGATDWKGLVEYTTKLGLQFVVHLYPTNNCQLRSISNFAELLLSSNKLDILKCIYSRKYLENQVLVDVLSNYEGHVEELFPKETIVFKQPYTSTNNSLMTMYLLKTSWLKD